jgi:hypothetical protein
MNAELKDIALQFIVHHSDFIVSSVSLWPVFLGSQEKGSPAVAGDPFTVKNSPQGIDLPENGSDNLARRRGLLILKCDEESEIRQGCFGLNLCLVALSRVDYLT